MTKSRQIIKQRSILIKSKICPSLKSTYKTLETSLKQQSNLRGVRDNRHKQLSHLEVAGVGQRENLLVGINTWPCKLQVMPEKIPGRLKNQHERPRRRMFPSVKSWSKPVKT